MSAQKSGRKTFNKIKLSSEGIQSDHVIRRSLKGLAADMLLSLEEDTTGMVSIADILAKFDSVFGNVLTSEALLGDENVAAWACKLENIRRQLLNGSMAHTATIEMLRSKFWHGLQSQSVKNATRQELLVTARSAESEYNIASPVVMSNPIQSSGVEFSEFQKQLS